MPSAIAIPCGRANRCAHTSPAASTAIGASPSANCASLRSEPMRDVRARMAWCAVPPGNLRRHRPQMRPAHCCRWISAADGIAEGANHAATVHDHCGHRCAGSHLEPPVEGVDEATRRALRQWHREWHREGATRAIDRNLPVSGRYVLGRERRGQRRAAQRSAAARGTTCRRSPCRSPSGHDEGQPSLSNSAASPQGEVNIPAASCPTPATSWRWWEKRAPARIAVRALRLGHAASVEHGMVRIDVPRAQQINDVAGGIARFVGGNVGIDIGGHAGCEPVLPIVVAPARFRRKGAPIGTGALRREVDVGRGALRGKVWVDLGVNTSETRVMRDAAGWRQGRRRR